LTPEQKERIVRLKEIVKWNVYFRI
jgi:hypothetical protein